MSGAGRLGELAHNAYALTFERPSSSTTSRASGTSSAGDARRIRRLPQAERKRPSSAASAPTTSNVPASASSSCRATRAFGDIWTVIAPWGSAGREALFDSQGDPGEDFRRTLRARLQHPRLLAADWASRHPDVASCCRRTIRVVSSRIGLVRRPQPPPNWPRYLEFLHVEEGQTIMARELQIPA